jgi:hypothetical protein
MGLAGMGVAMGRGEDGTQFKVNVSALIDRATGERPVPSSVSLGWNDPGDSIWAKKSGLAIAARAATSNPVSQVLW